MFKNGIFTNRIGDLSEWSNEPAWKACIRVTVSRVRIPRSPPYQVKLIQIEAHSKRMGFFTPTT